MVISVIENGKPLTRRWGYSNTVSKVPVNPLITYPESSKPANDVVRNVAANRIPGISQRLAPDDEGGTSRRKLDEYGGGSVKPERSDSGRESPFAGTTVVSRGESGFLLKSGKDSRQFYRLGFLCRA